MKDWHLITIDYDNKLDPNIIKACKFLKKSQIRVSASGNGFHVRGWAYCEDAIEVREQLGDDVQRIQFDKQVIERPRGMLWDSKTINGITMKAGNWIKYKPNMVIA